MAPAPNIYIITHETCVQSTPAASKNNNIICMLRTIETSLMLAHLGQCWLTRFGPFCANQNLVQNKDKMYVN